MARRDNAPDAGRAAFERSLAGMPALVGGKLCLDFANSIEPRGLPASPAGGARDYLPDYPALATWATHAGLVPAADALHLLARVAAQPALARAVFRRAISLREAIDRLVRAIIRGVACRPDDLKLLADEHAVATVHLALTATADGFAWRWRDDPADHDALDRPLWPIARSAIDRLTAGDLTRLKSCPGVPDAPPACAWLFYDVSRNRSGHWCSMSTPGSPTASCGGQSRARRQTARRRAARSGRPE